MRPDPQGEPAPLPACGAAPGPKRGRRGAVTEERLAVAALAAHGACSWSESMFVGALDPLRDEAARRAIVDRFYAAYAADVAAAPEGHAMDSVHCFMRVRKEA